MIKRIQYQDLKDNNPAVFIFPTKRPVDFSYPVVLLFIWFLGMFMIGNEFTGVSDRAMIAFLTIISLLWIVCGLFLVYVFIWRLYGKEVVEIRDGKLTVSKQIGHWKSDKAYESSQIQHLSLISSDDKSVRQSMTVNYFGIMGGNINLETKDGRSDQFGIQLGRDEAAEVLKFIKSHLDSKS